MNACHATILFLTRNLYLEINMPTARENFGRIVGLLFYLAIASTLFSFTTNLFASDKHNQGIKHNANAVSFAVIGDGPYGDEKEAAFDRMIDAINKDHEIEFVRKERVS